MFGLFSCDIGIDLGTANTLVHVAGRGLLINEPTVIAIDTRNNRVSAIGREAKKMLGRTPGLLHAVRPMRDGVIADFDLVETLLTTFIKRVQRYPLFIVHPRVVVGIPSGITEVEKRAVIDAATHAGAKEVHLVHEPMAAAIGMGIPVEEPVGHMVVDIGGGTSDIAVISLNGIVCQTSVRTAGDEMDQAIIRYMSGDDYHLEIGETTAEQIKIEIGSAYPLEKELTMEVKGYDTIKRLPRMVTVRSEDIRRALEGTIDTIIKAITETLAKTAPKLSADIYDKGIIMTGGGSLLRGFDERIREKTGLSVNVIDDALACVCKGTARILEELDKYRPVLIASSN